MVFYMVSLIDFFVIYEFFVVMMLSAKNKIFKLKHLATKTIDRSE